MEQDPYYIEPIRKRSRFRPISNDPLPKGYRILKEDDPERMKEINARLVGGRMVAESHDAIKGYYDVAIKEGSDVVLISHRFRREMLDAGEGIRVDDLYPIKR